MVHKNPICAILLWVLGAMACSGQWKAIPGTTTRVSEPENAEGQELKLRIFTDVVDCSGTQPRFVDAAEKELCLPHVDRAAGEVRLAYQFLLDDDPYPMPEFKEYLEVYHQGTRIQDEQSGQTYMIKGHDPIPISQLFILVIDGSSSMSEFNRMKKVKQALLMPEVQDAFFPSDRIKTGVLLLQFTAGAPRLVGSGASLRAGSRQTLPILYNKKDYRQMVKQLQVLQGYTHLYDAITYATGPLLRHPTIDALVDSEEMAVSVVALTDGFNNVNRNDTCSSNASRLQTLLEHIEQERSREDSDPRKRPSVFTVGLGRPLRANFEVPTRNRLKVQADTLCGKRNANTLIDGVLERQGIDNASLAWISDVGGGLSHVSRSKDGLGNAFRSAAAIRYQWFELRYRLPSFYLRRMFKTDLKMTSYASARAHLYLHPSAWLDGPTGKIRADGWTEARSTTQTVFFMSAVVVPWLGLLIAMGHWGAASFNIRRALLGRTRRPAPAPNKQQRQPPSEASEQTGSDGVHPP